VAKRTSIKDVALRAGVSVTTVSHALYPVPQHLKTGLTMDLLKQTDARSVLILEQLTDHKFNRLKTRPLQRRRPPRSAVGC